MKVIFFLCLTYSLSLSGQNLTLESSHQNSLYAHGSNYFRFVVKDVPCELILITINNGRIEQDSCMLNVVPAAVGETSLSFYNISNNDTLLVEHRNFRVVDLPLPQATLYKRNNGVFSKKAWLGCRGFEANYTQSQIVGCGVSATVTSYRVLVLRGDSLVGTINVEAPDFTDGVKTIFEKMESGDKVYFVDIWATSPLGDAIKLADLSFGVN